MKNFAAWPTILLLGRDGRVGSGDVYWQTQKDIKASVEKLLAEK